MISCPGFGLDLPADPALSYNGYFNTSAGCWSVFGEVTATIYANPVTAGAAHQRVVDTYAVQHAGGPHPDKSVVVHLVGLWLAIEEGASASEIAPLQNRLASGRADWPHWDPPPPITGTTIADVALADLQAFVTTATAWSQTVWEGWAPHHPRIERFARRALGAGG